MPHQLLHSREQVLCSMTELSLLVEAQASWPQGCECGRTDPSTCLSCGSVSAGEKASYCLFPLSACSTQESSTQNLNSGKTGPAHHQLHLAGTAK